MNHAITIGGLLLSVGVFVGLITAAIGLLSAFGNMMADAQGDGGKSGCIAFAVGLMLCIGCVIGLVL